MLIPEELAPDLRQALIDSLETLSDLLDEETDCLSRAQTDSLDLYLSTKRRLFEQLGVLLREAHRRPATAAITIEAGTDAAVADDVAPPMAEDEPASPDLLRAAAARLRRSVDENASAVRSVQDALGAVMQHMARVAERAQADGVYGRSGAASRGTLPGYGRVEHQL
ncbi:flagellar export chaperone FlgN [Oleisolibacter albus]|uniref:flagellar export chaperone FlgN n=1 Tax=Oleisolibacter albus TaxID=2171757 RepID=UPI00139016AA|nr:flagellar export chaperone FlgN [Oleisolibacter albus]